MLVGLDHEDSQIRGTKLKKKVCNRHLGWYRVFINQYVGTVSHLLFNILYP